MADVDREAFAIRLWNPLVAPPAPAPSENEHTRTDAPLNVQLIGIITEGTGEHAILRAALYDVDEDRLIMLADGERLRDRLVRILDRGRVELGEGEGRQRLTLRPDKEAS